jgi:hypothetical protein
MRTKKKTIAAEMYTLQNECNILIYRLRISLQKYRRGHWGVKWKFFLNLFTAAKNVFQKHESDYKINNKFAHTWLNTFSECKIKQTVQENFRSELSVLTESERLGSFPQPLDIRTRPLIYGDSTERQRLNWYGTLLWSCPVLLMAYKEKEESEWKICINIMKQIFGNAKQNTRWKFLRYHATGRKFQHFTH